MLRAAAQRCGVALVHQPPVAAAAWQHHTSSNCTLVPHSSWLRLFHTSQHAAQERQQEQERREGEPRQPGGAQQQPQQKNSQHEPREGQPGGAEQQPQQGGKQQQPQEQDEQKLEGPGGLLEEWRVNSCEWYSRWMATMLQLHLRTPQLSTWSRYFYTSRPGLLSRLLFPHGCSHFTYTLQWAYRDHTAVAPFLLQEAHKDYEAEAFKEGVKQALEYTTSLYAASDWVDLKPLVSAQLRESMQLMGGLQARLGEATGVTLSDVELEVDVDSVSLVCAHALTRQQLEVFDGHRAGEELPLVPVGADDEESATVDAGASAAAGAACSASAAPVAEGAAASAVWDAVHVYVKGTLQVSVQAAGARSPERLSIPKSGHVVLCRGPVHLDRVLSADEAAEKPWFLLGWL